MNWYVLEKKKKLQNVSHHNNLWIHIYISLPLSVPGAPAAPRNVQNIFHKVNEDVLDDLTFILIEDLQSFFKPFSQIRLVQYFIKQIDLL